MFMPCISFQGNCNEALEFYQQAIGAQLKSIHRFGPDAPADFKATITLPDDFVMNSELIIDGQPVMMTDGGAETPKSGHFSMTLLKDTEEQAHQTFNALAQGGTIVQNMKPVFWASIYGVVQDKFGLEWQVMTGAPE